MRKHHKKPVVSRYDSRTADEFIRQWCESVGSVRRASEEAELVSNHLHVWFADPDRRLSPDSTEKLSKAANLPFEALYYRFTKIKDLPMWKYLKAAG
jgi:hypothetical protein